MLVPGRDGYCDRARTPPCLAGMGTVTAPGTSPAEPAELATASGVAARSAARSEAPAGDPHPGTPEDRLIKGRGTTAAQWRAWPGWRDLRAASAGDLVPPGRRVVIVAPHPDDEVLGAGGLLAATAREGREQLLVAVTDGLGSHPGSRLWPASVLGAQRRGESAAALRELDAACPAADRRPASRRDPRGAQEGGRWLLHQPARTGPVDGRGRDSAALGASPPAA